MKVVLVDSNLNLVAQWQSSFRLFPEVEIICDDILHIAHNFIVLSANSYDFSLTTGIGQVAPSDAAAEMASVYAQWFHRYEQKL